MTTFIQDALTRAYDPTLSKSRAVYIVTPAQYLSEVRETLTSIAPSWGTETRLTVISPANSLIGFDPVTRRVPGVATTELFIDPRV